MFSFLKHVAASLRKSSHSRPSACGPRRRSLSLESLEDRRLLSASPLLMAVNPYGAIAQTRTLASQTYPSIAAVVPAANALVGDGVLQTPIDASLALDPAVVPAANPLLSDRLWETPIVATLVPDSGVSPVFHPEVPVYVRGVDDFRNVCFNLHSENGTSHQLTILTQNDSLSGSSTFTGVWDGGAAVTGILTVHGSDTNIKFTWGNNSHIFIGTISGDPGAYHMEGTVYVLGATNAPGFTVGDGVLCVPDLTGMKWKMPQANGGRNYSIQIDTQHDLPDGTATFTGTWSDHAAVTGTLRYEADGTLSISFTWFDPNNVRHQFDGTLSNDPTHNDIDGTRTVDGNSDLLHGTRVK